MAEDTQIESMVTITGAEYVRLTAENAKLREALEEMLPPKPRIQREVWVNVYRDPTRDTLHHNGMNADLGANMKRIACMKLTIDCEEGEGL